MSSTTTTTTTTTSVTQSMNSKQKDDSLMLKVMTAYMAPLLKKHNDHKLIVWEDLVSSNNAAVKLCGLHQQQTDPGIYDQVSVAKYKEQAKQGIRRWATSLAAQPMEESDTEQSFVDRCVEAFTKVTETSMPQWRLDDAMAIASQTVRQVASVTFRKYNPQPTENHTADDDVDQSGHIEEEEDNEHNEDEDDEEMEEEIEEENDADAGVATKKPTSATSRKPQNKKKLNGGNGKQMTVAKKTQSNAKAGNRPRGVRGGKRTGRGNGGPGGTGRGGAGRGGGRSGNHKRNNSRD